MTNDQIQILLNKYNHSVRIKVLNGGYILSLFDLRFDIVYRGIGFVVLKRVGQGRKHEFTVRW